MKVYRYKIMLPKQKLGIKELNNSCIGSFYQFEDGEIDKENINTTEMVNLLHHLMMGNKVEIDFDKEIDDED